MKSFAILLLTLILGTSAFTHLWNPVGFPDLFSDEGVYVRRALHVLSGLGPQESSVYYDHPYFGQLFLAGIFKIIGYPDSLHIAQNQSLEILYLIPRLLMGCLAVIDTFLIYLISKRQYNKKVALIAALLFAVMPISWLNRRILLEPIQVTFFLSSVLFALYTGVRMNTRISYNDNETLKKKEYFRLTSILLSGAFLGISIFTKIPIFVTIPFIGYVIFKNSNGSWKKLAFWLIPVISISLIWPAYSTAVGHLDDWQRTVAFQMHREGLPLTQRVHQLVIMEPALFIIGIAGLVISGLRRDLFILLWTVPIVLFICLINWSWAPYQVFIPLIPPFCILASLLIVKSTDRIRDRNIQKFILRTSILVISTFGLLGTVLLITTNVTSTQFQTVNFVLKYLNNGTNNNPTSDITIVSNPAYSWIFKYVFHKNNVLNEPNIFQYIEIKTSRILAISDAQFKSVSRTSEKLKMLDITSKTLIEYSGPFDTFDIEKYPYTNMDANFEGLYGIEVKLAKTR